MTHLCCTSVIRPITQPADGIQGGVSGAELGAESGRARDPNTGAQIVDNSKTTVALGAPYVPTIAMGVPRAMLRPAGNAPDLLEWNGDIGWNDTHSLFDPQSSMAQGEQERVAVTQRNTWRARPQPWDADLYVGVTPKAGR